VNAASHYCVPPARPAAVSRTEVTKPNFAQNYQHQCLPEISRRHREVVDPCGVYDGKVIAQDDWDNFAVSTVFAAIAIEAKSAYVFRGFQPISHYFRASKPAQFQLGLASPKVLASGPTESDTESLPSEKSAVSNSAHCLNLVLAITCADCGRSTRCSIRGPRSAQMPSR
jgi:hypothetical protein